MVGRPPCRAKGCAVINEGNYAQEALLMMKSVPPNADGTIGFLVMPQMPEWRAWRAYFYGKRMDVRASFMATRRDGYMVPCRNPADFDHDIAKVREEYAFRVHRGEVDAETRTGRLSSEMTPAERQDVLNRLAAASPLLRHHATETTWKEAAE